jgi:hypothetical protein
VRRARVSLQCMARLMGACASQVLSTCNEALEQLPPAEELVPSAAPPTEGEEEDEDMARVRQRLAARVVLGERSALEACVAVWEPALKEASVQ